MTELSTAQFLRLVAEPVRWRMLEELARSDRRVGELVELMGRPQNLVSYHLRELRDAGLVSARRSSADGRDTYYRVDAARCGALFDAASSVLRPQVGVAAIVPVRARAKRPAVLFLCTGNSSRSQMAEALLELRSGGAVAAKSAGSHPKPLHPDAVRAMAERGIDISPRRSKHLDRFTGAHFDRVITLCDKVREICPQLPGAPISAHWSMPDPAAEPDGYAAFARAADEIDERVRLLVAHLASIAPQPRPERRPA